MKNQHGAKPRWWSRKGARQSQHAYEHAGKDFSACNLNFKILIKVPYFLKASLLEGFRERAWTGLRPLSYCFRCFYLSAFDQQKSQIITNMQHDTFVQASTPRNSIPDISEVIVISVAVAAFNSKHSLAFQWYWLLLQDVLYINRRLCAGLKIMFMISYHCNSL